jgi:hypothetical protein
MLPNFIIHKRNEPNLATAQEVENFRNLAIFWKHVGTYFLSMLISEKNSSKSGDFSTFFPQKSFV